MTDAEAYRSSNTISDFYGRSLQQTAAMQELAVGIPLERETALPTTKELRPGESCVRVLLFHGNPVGGWMRWKRGYLNLKSKWSIGNWFKRFKLKRTCR